MTRAASNDNDPFAGLPLFASDRQIAAAIVGKDRAEHWIKNVLPGLRDFPSVDALHKGRALPLVRKFYDGYFGITTGFVNAKPDGEENLGWSKKKRAAERGQA